MRALALSSLLVWSLSAHAAPERPDDQVLVPAFGLNAQTRQMPSGMSVLMLPDATSPTVAMTLLVGAGIANDPAGASGTAMLMERVMMMAPGPDGEASTASRLRGLGCDVDGLVAHDHMAWSASCPRDMADQAMAVLSDVLTGTALERVDEALLNQEKKRLMADISLRRAGAGSGFQEAALWLRPKLYAEGHGYDRKPLQDVDGVTLAHLAEFAKTALVPRNVTIGLLGGFDDRYHLYGPSILLSNLPPTMFHPKLKPDHMKRLAKGEVDDVADDNPNHWFTVAMDPENPSEPMAEGKSKTRRRSKMMADPPAAAVDGAYSVQTGPVQKPMVAVGWALPASWGDDDVLQRVTARVINQFVAQNMDVGSVEAFNGCNVVSGARSGLLVCLATLKEGRDTGDRVGRAIVDQLSFINNPDPQYAQAVEVAYMRARNQLLGDTLMGMDAGGRLGAGGDWLVLEYVHYLMDPAAHIDRLQGASGMTVDDVKAYVDTWLKRDRVASVRLEPPAAAPMAMVPELVQQDDQDATARAKGYWTLAVAPSGQAFSASALSSEAIDYAAPRIPEDSVMTRTLGNGLEVVAVSAGAAPILHARVVALDGTTLDPTDHHHWTFGRQHVRPNRPAEPAKYGGRLSSWRGDNTHVIDLEVAADNHEQALYGLRFTLDELRVTFNKKGTWLADQRKAMLDDHYTPEFQAYRWAERQLGSPNLMRRPGLEDLAAWAEVSTTEVKDMMLTKWAPERMKLILVGPQDPETLLDAAETYFGDYKVSGAPTTPVTFRASTTAIEGTAGTAIFSDDGPATLTARCSVGLANGLNDPRPHVLGSLIELGLNEGSGGVLTGLDATATIAPDGAALLTVRAQTDAKMSGKVHAALGSLLTEASDASDDSAVRRAALVHAGRLSADRRTVQHLAGLVTARAMSGLDPMSGDAYADALSTLDAKGLAASAAACAGSLAAVWRGEEAQLASSLSAEGIEHASFDWMQHAKDVHETADPKGFAKWEKAQAKGR